MLLFAGNKKSVNHLRKFLYQLSGVQWLKAPKVFGLLAVKLKQSLAKHNVPSAAMYY